MLLSLFACDTPDTGDTAADTTPWQDVAENLPGALLSVWGRAADDVFVVGADPGDGPMAFHRVGAGWVAVDGLTAGDVWWVSGDADRVWFAGAGGRVFRGDAEGADLEAWVLDPDVTFFGVWGPGDGTAWAVGGDPSAPSDAAAAWYFDGGTWAEVALPEDAAAKFALYKVWGSAADDVWAVGAGGIILHHDGAAWGSVPSLTTVPLFTFHEGYAVGGVATGAILRANDGGGSFTEESPPYALPITGVHGGDAPVAVGAQGSVWFRTDGAWVADPRERPTYQDLHSVWRDPDGGVWAVGGHVSSAPLIQGALVYSGDAIVPALEG